MGAAVDHNLKLLNEVFEQERSHAPLLTSVHDLTAAQAAWKPSPERNSIWKIVNHVSLWKEYSARRMAGEPPRPFGWAKEVDWQEILEVTEEAWRASVQRLRHAHAAVKAELAKRSDDDLERPLPGGRYPLYRIQSVAVHNAYHVGQIRYIRALQGVPTAPY